LLAAIGLLAASVPAGAQDLLFPEWEYEPGDDVGAVRRAAGKSAAFGYSFVNDTVSDTWTMTQSPLHWSLRDWVFVAGLAGVTTGMIYTVDPQMREATRDSQTWESYGEGIRYLGNGPGLVALTGGFALVGNVWDRPKERETARLLLEASASGYLFTIAGKYTLGRSRPRANRGPRAFDPFSGAVSMPSGEATSAFIMAGVVTSQYPSWPVQLTAYSLATAVGLGRIALDAHWTSDIFVSAVLGIAVSKAVVHLNRKRAEKKTRLAKLKKRGVTARKRDVSRHFIQVTPRAFRWTYIF
jgi:membrane-associated phospholipid phosphatase